LAKTEGIIAIFNPASGYGGSDRMLVNLCRGLVDLGQRPDFLVNKAQGPYVSLLPPQVRLVELGTRHHLSLLLPLALYLRRERPAVLLSAMRSEREALRGRRLAAVPTRIFVRIETTPSQRDSQRNLLRRWRSRWRMRMLYPRADGLVAVSRGVAEDVAMLAPIAREKIHVIPNPVVTPEFGALAASPVGHPWFATRGAPVILGAGGMRRSKDFPTLIRAFARVREKRPVRLVILGEGRQRRKLQVLAASLGIGHEVSFPGFVVNPYAYMARASLFVLSSAWEGSPNVLVEALAVGTPVVATDCRSGPREILQDGRYGPLVPVGDAGAMAGAITRTLDAPLPAETLKVAAEPYRLHMSCRRYLEAFGIEAG
jgi:glycosyltransferase involved in cell wall biosynthesis